MNSREQTIFRKYLERRGLKLTSERQALFGDNAARIYAVSVPVHG